MHYYQFNIADYRKDTTHLSMLEHGAYRQLLDWHYLDQTPIPLETEVVFRRLSAKTKEEQEAILIVLKELFIHTNEGYIQHRVMHEIAQYEAKAGRARDNGKLGGRPSKTKVVISGNLEQTQEKANSLTNKPITNINSKGSRLPKDWVLSDEYYAEAKKINSNLSDGQIEFIADGFKDYWIGLSGSKGVKSDWIATWRNWVRNQKGAPQSKSSAEKPEWERNAV